MNSKIAGLLFVFLMFVGISSAQHGASSHGSAPHFQSHGQVQHQEQPRPRGAIVAPRGGDYRGWYAGRSEYLGFGWGHRFGWYYRPYAYLGVNYCYAGAWGAPYFTFGFNASRWRVVDFDFAIVDGWYPNSCAYVVADPAHYGWYLLYDQQTGQYVHVEEY